MARRSLSEVLPGILQSFKPDLVLYDAGVDPHEEDELGRLALTDEGLQRRELLVGRGGCCCGLTLEHMRFSAEGPGGEQQRELAAGREHDLYGRLAVEELLAGWKWVMFGVCACALAGVLFLQSHGWVPAAECAAVG